MCRIFQKNFHCLTQKQDTRILHVELVLVRAAQIKKFSFAKIQMCKLIICGRKRNTNFIRIIYLLASIKALEMMKMKKPA